MALFRLFPGLGATPWLWLLLVLPLAADEFRSGDVATVIEQHAEFGLREQLVAQLAAGTALKVTEVRGGWVGGYPLDGGDKRLGWIDTACLRRVAARAGQAGGAERVAEAIRQLRQAELAVQLDGDGFVYGVEANAGRSGQVDWSQLAQFERLVTLDAGGSSLDDAALAVVCQARSLERLYLNDTPISSAALAPLAALVQLDVLVLAETRVGGDGLAALARLPRLRTLNLAGCPIQDQDLMHLAGLQSLEVLTLCDTPLDGSGLLHLRNLDRLRVLNLSGSQLQNAGLTHLEGLPSLRMLYVERTAVTEKAVRSLDATLTSCAIFRN